MNDDLVRLTIEALGVDGDGVARRRGETWFVPGTAPGDVVEALAEASDRAAERSGGRGGRRGRVLRIVTASPHRVPAPCAAAGGCGGCDWGHLAPDERLRWKLRLVRETLGLGDEPAVESIPSPGGGRRVARLAVGRDREGAIVGFRAERSSRVVSGVSCPALEPEAAEAVSVLGNDRAVLAEWLKAGGEELWLLSDVDRRIHLAAARAEAPAGGRRSGGPRAAGPSTQEVLERLRAALPGALRPSGEPCVEAADGGPALRVPPGGFVQGSRAVGLELARIVAEAAGPTPGLTLELYAGSGHLTVALLRGVEELVAVEADGESARALGENLARRAVAGAKAVRGDATSMLRTLARPPALVVADPPRAGLEAAAYELVRHRPPRVILVSCDLRALGRDVRVLLREGYAVERVALCDMFPATHHVEVVTLFTVTEASHSGRGAGRKPVGG
ncbi:MAG: class I SAM-dependent RNA methyltransferase [Deltaproteobacteria bacterium]|nr:class I SAM-dependent RNA methyltransferase [Deltaproteobacteria bacterium]